MDETTFRILDAMSDMKLCSINSLTNKIRKLHKTAYYKNIYDKIQQLEKKGIIKLERIGKSSASRLNFSNYLLMDLLSEMELKKKQNFLQKRNEMQMLFMEMDAYFKQSLLINSISIIDPEKNISFNRLEFLFILKDSGPRENSINEEIGIHKIMQNLEKKHNIKLDCLILSDSEFLGMMKQKQINPLKPMLLKQTAFFSPQNYWTLIRKSVEEGADMESAEEINPAKISEQDMIYNLNRFGYKEFGPAIKQGKEISPEFIIISILIKDSARRIEIIPVLIAKNRINYRVLAFLCMKYEKSEKLLGLLKALEKIKKNRETENTIKILEKIGIKEKKADINSVRQKMRLYNAV